MFCFVKNSGAALEPDEFMNSKKSHEVQSMSEVVACLAQRCGVKQVEDHLNRSSAEPSETLGSEQTRFGINIFLPPR